MAVVTCCEPVGLGDVDETEDEEADDDDADDDEDTDDEDDDDGDTEESAAALIDDAGASSGGGVDDVWTVVDDDDEEVVVVVGTANRTILVGIRREGADDRPESAAPHSKSSPRVHAVNNTVPHKGASTHFCRSTKIYSIECELFTLLLVELHSLREHT